MAAYDRFYCRFLYILYFLPFILLFQPVGGIAMYDSYLEIEQAMSSDLGEYTCQIMNEKGQTQKKVILSPIGNYI